jgi:hypothetical protein
MMSTQSRGAVAGWQAAAELQPLVKNWWMMSGREGTNQGHTA